MQSISLRPALTLAAALALVVPPARATWSIVVVDRATGEVCVAAATCLNTKLQNVLPSIVPEVGVGAAQSVIDSDGSNLALIQAGLLAHWTPQEIMDELALVDPGHETRQYGVVSMFAPPVTFTGNQAGAAALGVTGEVGTLAYAIQGNVLTGDPVVLAAETALLGTVGDLSQRAMAAMEAARLMGGDGRCSCDPSAPTSCGSPPATFVNSALSSFIVLARPGNQVGPCGPLGGQGGCTTGTYYLLLWNKGFGQNGPTVKVLQGQYDAWRVSMAGIPDAYKTTVTVDPTALVADGHSRTTVHVQLADIEGVALTKGGYQLQVRRVRPGYPPALALPAHDLHDGSYTFELAATTLPGRATFRVVIENETTSVRLPDFSIYVAPPSAR